MTKEKTTKPVEEKKTKTTTKTTKSPVKKESKTVTKTTTTRKPRKAKQEVKAIVEFADRQYDVAQAVQNAKDAFVAMGNKESDIKTLNIYIKPEECAVYFVVNDEINGKADL